MILKSWGFGWIFATSLARWWTVKHCWCEDKSLANQWSMQLSTWVWLCKMLDAILPKWWTMLCQYHVVIIWYHVMIMWRSCDIKWSCDDHVTIMWYQVIMWSRDNHVMIMWWSCELMQRSTAAAGCNFASVVHKHWKQLLRPQELRTQWWTSCFQPRPPNLIPCQIFRL